MPTLVLLRHGESTWNSENRFTGWVDVPLTALGEDQARHSGVLLRAAGLLPTAVHTSVLARAVRTAALTVEAAGLRQVQVHHHWRLNERCYGALQGLDRSSVRTEYGDDQYQLWRRSYDVAPPPVEPGSAWDTASGAVLDGIPAPRTESLADVVQRLLPYWAQAIAPALRTGGPVLVVAHGNSLRALVAHLDALTPKEVLDLNIPTGMPLHYELDDDLTPVRRGGRYLEPAAAARAAAEVAQQGR